MPAASTSVGYGAPPRRVAPRGARLGAALLAAFSALAAALAQEIRLRRDARRLAELSDHMLKDIGISRGEIESAVRDGGPPRPGAGAPHHGAVMPPAVTLPPWLWTEWR